MAGIGIRLNKIFNKNSIAAKLFGFGYSMMVTIAPMIIIIAVVILMQVLLEYSKLGYATRELYSCTVLYIFIFALMAASPFTAVISKFMSDLIYEEKYDDIPPCFYMGLVINLIVGVIPIWTGHRWLSPSQGASSCGAWLCSPGCQYHPTGLPLAKQIT